MAGEWIKMRCDLAEQHEVIAIAEATGLDEFAVVGRLHRFWSWADKTSTDGSAPGVTGAWLDRYVSAPGFAESMVSVGWLVISDEGLSVPDFNEHMSESAKKRALKNKRSSVSKAKSAAKSAAKVSPEALPKCHPKRWPEEEGEEEYLNDQLLSSARPLAGVLFDQMNFADESPIVWQAASLVVSGELSEHEAIDSARGCVECGAKNPPAYFRTSLSKIVAGRGVDLKDLLRTAKLPKNFPTGPPGKTFSSGVRELADLMAPKE